MIDKKQITFTLIKKDNPFIVYSKKDILTARDKVKEELLYDIWDMQFELANIEGEDCSAIRYLQKVKKDIKRLL